MKKGKFSIAGSSPPCLKHKCYKGRMKVLGVSWGTSLMAGDLARGSLYCLCCSPEPKHGEAMLALLPLPMCVTEFCSTESITCCCISMEGRVLRKTPALKCCDRKEIVHGKASASVLWVSGRQLFFLYLLNQVVGIFHPEITAEQQWGIMFQVFV